MLINRILDKYKWVISVLPTIILGLFLSACTSGPSAPTPVTAPTSTPAAAATSAVTATPAAAATSVATTPPSKYENTLVRRPGNSPEDSKVYVVQNGRKRWVVNASWFAAHGFKFPDAVQVLTNAEFDAIPIGDPIQ